MKKIYFAAGCFWGSERYFQLVKGVTDTTVGYANGTPANPSYEMLKAHVATHAETVEVVYDENIITLKELVELYFRIIDPYSINKQGEDEGLQYRTGIYWQNEMDKKDIYEVVSEMEKEAGKKFVVELKELENFYLAEEYHQDYLIKNPNGYCHVNFCLLKQKERKENN